MVATRRGPRPRDESGESHGWCGSAAARLPGRRASRALVHVPGKAQPSTAIRKAHPSRPADRDQRFQPRISENSPEIQRAWVTHALEAEDEGPRMASACGGARASAQEDARGDIIDALEIFRGGRYQLAQHEPRFSQRFSSFQPTSRISVARWAWRGRSKSRGISPAQRVESARSICFHSGGGRRAPGAASQRPVGDLPRGAGDRIVFARPKHASGPVSKMALGRAAPRARWCGRTRGARQHQVRLRATT